MVMLHGKAHDEPAVQRQEEEEEVRRMEEVPPNTPADPSPAPAQEEKLPESWTSYFSDSSFSRRPGSS